MSTQVKSTETPHQTHKQQQALFTRSTISAALLAVAAGVSTGVHAQTGSTARLEEVVVTAQRRTEGLQSIPISIAAVTGDDLSEMGITGFQRLSEAVPGLYLERPGSAVTSALYIRGVGTSGLSSAGQSVGVAVDGVYILRQGAVFNELMDIDRIEVLRGPQGTLFGKNTTAGAINVITRDPETSEFSGSIQGVVGSLDNTELRGVINVPLIEDKLAIRLAGFTARQDGPTENVFIDENTRNIDREGYRAKLLWNVTDNFQMKLGAEKIDNYQDMDQGNVTTGVGLGEYSQQHGYVSEDIERYTLHMEWEVANHVISTISSYDETVPILFNDYDETPIPILLLKNTSTTEVTTHEIQLASEFDGPFSYIAGYFYQEEKLDSPTEINGNQVITTVRDQDSQAVFGTVNYEFNDQWTASVGLRYTEDTKQGTNVVFSGDKTFSKTTYSTKLMYQLNVDTMLYASYGTGFKAGGINNINSLAQADKAFWDPETTDAFELGIKSELLDNRLRVNATAFYQTFDDFLVSQTYPSEVRSVVTNAAEVESMGIEAEFTALVNDNLTINGSLTWVESEYADNENQSCVITDYPGCVNGSRDLTGETLDHAPEFSGNLGAEWRQSFVAGTEWFTRMDVIYRGSQYLEVWLPEETKEDAYTLANLRLGLQGESWKVTGWVNNVFDEEYRTSAFWTVSPIGTGPYFHEIPNLERTYGVTVDWSF